MHLTGRRAPRALAVATRWADGTDITEYQPRARAIQWLRERITDQAAGLDPYDSSVFIVDVGAHERVWGYRAFELAGTVLFRTETGHGGQRIRGILEADARDELGLDGLTPPLMGDEPLASRAVAYDFSSYGVATGIAALEAPPLHSVPDQDRDGSEAMLALRVARAAYDRRYPEGA